MVGESVRGVSLCWERGGSHRRRSGGTFPDSGPEGTVGSPQTQPSWAGGMGPSAGCPPSAHRPPTSAGLSLRRRSGERIPCRRQGPLRWGTGACRAVTVPQAARRRPDGLSPMQRAGTRTQVEQGPVGRPSQAPSAPLLGRGEAAPACTPTWRCPPPCLASRLRLRSLRPLLFVDFKEKQRHRQNI